MDLVCFLNLCKGNVLRYVLPEFLVMNEFWWKPYAIYVVVMLWDFPFILERSARYIRGSADSWGKSRNATS